MEIELIRQKLALMLCIPDENIEINLVEDAWPGSNDRILRTIVREYQCKTGERVRYPANWKEAVKERFAPKWYLKKHPVKYLEFGRFISFPEFFPKEFGRIENRIIRIYGRDDE